MDANLDANRRRFARGTRRIPCELLIEGDMRRTIVLDLSPTGIFLQLSRATTDLPMQKRVTVVLDVEPQRISVEAEVARVQKSHRAVTAVHASGVGLTVVSAPERYYQLLTELC